MLYQTPLYLQVSASARLCILKPLSQGLHILHRFPFHTSVCFKTAYLEQTKLHHYFQSWTRAPSALLKWTYTWFKHWATHIISEYPHVPLAPPNVPAPGTFSQGSGHVFAYRMVAASWVENSFPNQWRCFYLTKPSYLIIRILSSSSLYTTLTGQK